MAAYEYAVAESIKMASTCAACGVRLGADAIKCTTGAKKTEIFCHNHVPQGAKHIVTKKASINCPNCMIDVQHNIDHLQHCPERQTTCDICKQQFTAHDLGAHEHTCALAHRICEKCGMPGGQSMTHDCIKHLKSFIPK
jgi:hypothetical protein